MISLDLGPTECAASICASPGSVIPGYAETPAKLIALDDILDDAIVRRGEKVVLWSFYTSSIDAIVER